ncbi:MAG: response regulator [Desulfobacterales bacterium]|nr:response regulator [Desulfobacterales bacterium]
MKISKKHTEKSSQQTSQPPEKCKRLSHILLAEDDLEMRRMLGWSLRQIGYEVIECEDGICLMKQLGLLGPSEKAHMIDLILSDIRMPGVTGMEVLESARAFDDFPPILLMTAFGDEETQMQAERLGAVAVLNKPFDMNDLLERIHQTISIQTLPKQEPAESLSFPIDIVFRHRSSSAPLKAFVEEMASKLNRYADQIMHCQVVIHKTSSTSQHGPHYHVTVNLALPRKRLVVKHPSGAMVDHENAYLAIQVTFGKVYHQLKHHFNRHSSKQRHRQRHAMQSRETI